jgi:Pre-toxin TG
MGGPNDWLKLTDKESAEIDAAIERSPFLSNISRMVRDRATDHKLVRAAEPYVDPRIILSSSDKTKTERLLDEAEFSYFLSQTGITEQEYSTVVAYVHERLMDDAQANRKVSISASDIEQRILATRAVVARHPESIDIRGYTIGVFSKATAVVEWTGVLTLGEVVVFLVTHPRFTLSLILDFIPVIGDIKGMAEAIIGRDLITFEKLPNWARGLSFAASIAGFAKICWKLVKAGIRAGAKIAAKALAPIVIFAAITNKTPAASMRFMREAAAIDESVLVAASKRAPDIERGAVAITKVEAEAMQQMTRLLSPEEIAKVEKAVAREAAKTIDAVKNSGKSLPDLGGTGRAVVTGTSGAGRAGRKPKGKGKGAPKVTPKVLPEWISKLKGKLSKRGALKEVAAKVHSLEKLEGQTVAAVEVKIGDRTVYAAASNSGASAGEGFTKFQEVALKKMDIVVIPSTLNEAVHAEINVLKWLNKMKEARKTGEVVTVVRWGISSGRQGYRICEACKAVLETLGGEIETFENLGKTY